MQHPLSVTSPSSQGVRLMFMRCTSTGMDYSKRRRMRWMVLLSLLSARLFPTILSCKCGSALIASLFDIPCSYNFNVPDQSGTYWYHSHLSTQYCDGLRYEISLVLNVLSAYLLSIAVPWSSMVCSHWRAQSTTAYQIYRPSGPSRKSL